MVRSAGEIVQVRKEAAPNIQELAWSYQRGPSIVGASLAHSDTGPGGLLFRICSFTCRSASDKAPLCRIGSRGEDSSVIMSEHRTEAGIVQAIKRTYCVHPVLPDLSSCWLFRMDSLSRPLARPPPKEEVLRYPVWNPKQSTASLSPPQFTQTSQVPQEILPVPLPVVPPPPLAAVSSKPDLFSHRVSCGLPLEP